MNIVLIYPRFPDTFWNHSHALKILGRKSAFPPLGLLTVAAMLPDDWQLRVVDLNVRELSAADLAWADMAFVSAMIVQRDSAVEAIELCHHKGLRVVAGGPLFANEHHKFDLVDHFVLGEAEVSLEPFLHDLASGTPERIYHPKGYADLSQSPIPRWDLVRLDDYASLGVQFSRGCPHACEFCNVTTLFGHRPRTKKVSQVLAELAYLYRLGWRGNMFFVDDNLMANKRITKQELLPALIKWRQGKKSVPFNTQVTIDLVDDEEALRLMRKAGFTQVFVGIETPDELCLAESNKPQNCHRDMVKDVRKLHSYGIQVQAGFIVGFDGDTPSIFQRQVEFIQQSGILSAMVTMLHALPGTELYARLKREGRIIDVKKGGDGRISFTNILTKMDPELLRQGYWQIIQQIYSASSYYQRLKSFLRDYTPPEVGVPLSARNCAAGLRSIYQLGIRDKQRRHFWGLLAWTLWHRPTMLTRATVMAVAGYHYRLVEEFQDAGIH
ncbi:B12-binding domain-containing radical SAM protein [Oligoflexia bacterium]|nr:B12-binding domain-containing radical SAM protein [Oligoflexia bacterium]